MGANEIQHGGNHYKGADYQHWDFVCDTRLHYLLGVATKYVSRWRKKDGLLDLQKADHYIDKAMERGLQGSSVATRHASFWEFVLCNDISMLEAATIYYLMEGNLQAAKEGVADLLKRASSEDRTAES